MANGNLTLETLELRYVPFSEAQVSDENPKRHDLEALKASIHTYGFGDPPKYDATLEALVYGNGRSTALAQMYEEKEHPPRGIAVGEDGEWVLPVITPITPTARIPNPLNREED